MTSPAIYGPDPLSLEGRTGLRYWLHQPRPFTGNRFVDDRLSGYPVAVFLPPGRQPEQTPVVIGLQGMAAPYQWNGFIVPTLLDMGIGCVLFDTPLAGERSLARNHLGDAVSELAALLRHNAPVRPSILRSMMEAVADDFSTVLRLLEERHGLTDSRRALFGVSLGTLLSSFAFMRDGMGLRLLGTIGHADLNRFARSYTPFLTPLLANLPVRTLVRIFSYLTGKKGARAAVEFLTILRKLCHRTVHSEQANPMSYLDRVKPPRRVRFLVGEIDPVVRPQDAKECARMFPDGECYIVPGLEHGGGMFEQHVRTFLGTQLGDWRW
jgi:hypothetical protein